MEPMLLIVLAYTLIVVIYTPIVIAAIVAFKKSEKQSTYNLGVSGEEGEA